MPTDLVPLGQIQFKVAKVENGNIDQKISKTKTIQKRKKKFPTVLPLLQLKGIVKNDKNDCKEVNLIYIMLKSCTFKI